MKQKTIILLILALFLQNIEVSAQRGRNNKQKNSKNSKKTNSTKKKGIKNSTKKDKRNTTTNNESISANDIQQPSLLLYLLQNLNNQFYSGFAP